MRNLRKNFILVMLAAASVVLSSCKKDKVEPDDDINPLDSLIIEGSKIMAGDKNDGAYFGDVLATSENLLAIGAKYDDNSAKDAGAVYMLNYGTEWALGEKIVASDASKDLQFGRAVHIHGDNMIVGAKFGAYLFKNEGGSWIEKQKLEPWHEDQYQKYISAVFITDEYAFVGKSTENFEIGSVYVFKLNGGTWEQDEKLQASDKNSPGNFGSDIIVSGDKLIIASSDYSKTVERTGAVYYFKNEGGSWTEKQIIIPDDVALQSYFGYSIALQGDDLVVGAYGDKEKASFAGAVYVYHYNGASWEKTQKLFAPDGESMDLFGRSVAISDNFILAGATSAGGKDGRAYLFSKVGGEWVYRETLTPESKNTGMGQSAAIVNSYAFVGAVNEAFADDKGGTVYMFEISNPE